MRWNAWSWSLFALLGAGLGACTGATLVEETPAPARPGEMTPGGPGPGGGAGALPGPKGPPCDPASKSFAPARIWQLSDRQYVNVVRDVFGLTLSEEDGRIISAGAADRYNNYSEEGSIDTQAAPNYQMAASKVADLLEPRLAMLVGAAAPSPAQVQTFIRTKIARAWRRPLADAEVAALTKIYSAAQVDGAGRAFHLVIEAALQAPSFLYRTELGGNAAAARGPVQLTPHELASALSFLFLDSSPDDALWARAEAGNLNDPAVLAGEVDRLMKLPQARANLTKKASYWLGLEAIPNRSRQPRLYPEWTEAVKGLLSESAQHFLGDVVANGKLTDLFTSNRVWLNGPLAQLYGISGVRGQTLMPIAVPGNQRSAGILSQPGLIVAATKFIDRSDVVHRGLMVHDAFVCGGAIPPAPPQAGDEAKKMEGTERDRANSRAAMAACRGCHAKFDPYGLTFERYDAIGRYSETRQAVLDSKTGVTSWKQSPTPIDASSEVLDDGGGDGLAGPIDGVDQLALKLAGAKRRVGACASRKLAEYALGFNPEAHNSCELQAVKEVLVTTGSFTEFFRALALSPGFRTRNPLPARAP